MAAKAKRKSYTEADKEKALHVYAATENLRETSRQLNIPLTTLKQWADIWKVERAEEIERIRAEKKQRFVEQANEIIESGMKLLQKRLSTALEKEDELTKIINQLAGDTQLTGKERQMLIAKLKDVQINKIVDLSTMLGTIYDKRALAAGEATENIASVIKVVIDD